MNHLRITVIAVDFSADQHGCVELELFLDIFSAGMEKNEVHCAGLVADFDAVRGRAARVGDVFIDADLYAGDAAVLGGGDCWIVIAVDHVDGQV